MKGLGGGMGGLGKLGAGPKAEHLDEDAARPLQLGLIMRLLRLVDDLAWKRNTLFVIVLVRAMQVAALAWLLGFVIDDLVRHRDYRRLCIGAGAWLGLNLFTNLTFHFRQRFALELGEHVVHDLRARVFSHLQRQPMSFFDRTKLGRIISRMVSDIEAVRTGVQDVLFVSMVAMGQMVVAAALMLLIDPVMFGVVAVIAPVIWLINRYFSLRMADAFRAMQESFSRVTSNIAESVNGIRVTQSFVRQDTNATAFQALVVDHSRYNLRSAVLRGTFLPLLELNNQAFLAALLLVGGWRTFGGEMAVGDIIQFFFLAGVFFSPIANIGNQYNQALHAMAGAERVFALLDSQPDWSDAPDASDLDRIAGRVEFRDVTFGYVADQPVLHGISFVAAPGQMVALVGHTGCGKSTIVSLLAKFRLPDSGQVLVDGRDLATVRSASLHQRFAMVTQDNFLFSGTVLDNIRFGRPEADATEVLAVLKRLDCLDLLEGLPDGLRTEVGERGASLSLGQRQLVCFARAMLADPAILILDEATSAIDTMTEARLQRAVTALLSGRTSFVVAHRLSTIRHADLVLVMDQGRIIERGSHRDLLALGGHYAELYRQFIRAGAA